MTFFLGVYTRVSVYRDWINETIYQSTRSYDAQLFNMPNNIDMSNDLEIWWDRGVGNEAENNFIASINQLVCGLLMVMMMRIKYQ